MKARQQAVVGLLAAALVGGCQVARQPDAAGGSSSEVSSTETGNGAPAVQPAPVAGDAGGDASESAEAPVLSNVELIARKAEAHARRMVEEMQREGKTSTSQAATPAPGPVAGWLDDGAFHIGSALRRASGGSVASGDALAVADAASGASAAMGSAAPTELVVQPADAAETESSTANKPVSIEAPTPAAGATAAVVTARPAGELSPVAGSGLQAEVAKALRDHPRDVATHLDYQLLQFVQGKQAPDLAAVATLPDEDQEIISAVMDALVNFRHTVKSDSNPLLSRKVKPLMELGERLRARADLEVPTVQLCRRVDGYGVYEPVEARLVAGQPHQVIVYCEIENFMSQLNGQHLWETKLTEELVLYTENDGLPILREAPVVVPDVCRNRRSDFFIVRKLSLPATIPVGRYLLKVTVVDQLASRVAEATLPITFVAN